MAIAAILFSLWYPEIAKTLEIKPKPYKEDNIEAYKIVKSVFFSKALPVALMALSVALIFLPDAIKLVNESLAIYNAHGFAAINTYNAVKMAYCFVSLISSILAFYMCVLAINLWKLAKSLS